MSHGIVLALTSLFNAKAKLARANLLINQGINQPKNEQLQKYQTKNRARKV
ncbi:hypothetical protein METHB2_380018 [Candidatus Methylobacter favarea]|uniref:Uncharacterized protein n=1 Tax=Candidatus Methylobacter favarea TaxID=2707345 RepID=A0A8S0WQ57_9GAMM|nr:hypothetical protein METHB2_380018 [Candidatus Methylobacter favarea]